MERANSNVADWRCDFVTMLHAVTSHHLVAKHTTIMYSSNTMSCSPLQLYGPLPLDTAVLYFVRSQIVVILCAHAYITQYDTQSTL